MQNIVNQQCIAGGSQSLKTPVLGIDRSRVSLPSVLICKRMLKVFWMQIIIIFFFVCVFKVLQCTMKYTLVPMNCTLLALQVS